MTSEHEQKIAVRNAGASKAAPRARATVTLRNVSVGAGGDVEAPLLHAVNLTVRPGECVLVCGRSGAGKTTITKCVNGLIPSFEPGLVRTGEVDVCGVDPACIEMYELARHVGSVFQNPKSQFFNLASTDELAFGLETAGVDADEIERRIRETVTELGAENLLGRNVTRMSGGEKQSLVFASVAVADPDVYLLDEPTANLDVRAIRTLHDEVARVLARGRTVVVSEHRLYFLADLIDRAVYVNGGRIEREFTREELVSLTAEQRTELGLRAVAPTDALALTCPAAHIPSADAPLIDQGLSLRAFACRRGRRGRRRSPFKPVSLDVPRGTVAGIMGDNGVGKTTLLRALAGLEKHCEGTVSFDGRPLDPHERSDVCAMVMQDVNWQLMSDSVYNECELALGAAGDRPDTGQRIASTLASLGLSGLEQRHPLALSGGQKQRLALACALLAGRRLLLLDEPTSGLDFEHMVEVANLMRSLAADGASVVVVSHDREFLSRACDSVISLTGDVHA